MTVERVAITGQASQADLPNAFQDQDIEVPVMGEEAVVGKQVREVEEVRLHKQASEEQQQVSDTVRRERVVVDGKDSAFITPSYQAFRLAVKARRGPRQTRKRKGSRAAYQGEGASPRALRPLRRWGDVRLRGRPVGPVHLRALPRVPRTLRARSPYGDSGAA
ncbi:MAG: YsnF/AvaK domain-containing protein [Chloroflexota bacterium]|nr:YsnF/AvaK domain-containing protein [Chloroflexota bacterium]